MANPRQFRSTTFRLGLGVTTAVLALAMVFVLTVVTTEAAYAQSYQVIHNFTGPDGAKPVSGLTLDRGGKLYGTLPTGHGGSNWGGVYQMRRAGTGWIFGTLHVFDGTLEGGVTFGPDGLIYGTSPNNLTGYPSGYLYSLSPSVNPCLTSLCGWNMTMLYGFLGGSDGGTPLYGDLIFDQAGNMYGTTSQGGSGSGVVFEATGPGSSWTEQAIYTFGGTPDGATPENGLIFDNAGNLYGTTTAGGASGNGTVFELSPSGSGWTENILYSFQGSNDGSDPIAGLIFDGSGNLYGATASGGSAGGGTVFELSPNGGSWTHNVIYNFTGASKCGPWGSVYLLSGNLYGTTLCDGANNLGNVWELAASGSGWTYSSLYDFTGGNDGGNPYCNVVSDVSGNLYGSASNYGSHNDGVVWEITP
jgi:uncharacterized repeat protein (TIGR03803 family)